MFKLYRKGRAVLALIAILTLAGCGTNGTGASNPASDATASASDAVSSAAAAPASAAAGGQTNAGASGEPVKLVWGFWGSPEEKATHEKVAQAFMQEHPNITIEVWHQPWDDYFTKLQTIWASGDKSAVPDVLFLWPTPRYAADGVLENLDPYIQQSSYNLNDYWPALLESATYNNSVYGLPRDISVEVLYYNKQVFDEAGVAYPNENWTWDDLRAAAEKLTVVEANGRVRRYGLAMEGGKYQEWIGQNKGSILDDMRNPSKCTIADPPAAQAISFFADLMNRNLAMRSANLSQAGGDAAVFQAGQAAMIIQNASRVPTFNQAGLSYDVAPVPIPQGGQRAASAGGAAWTMSAASSHKQEAWTFIQWLQSTDGGQRLYTETGESLPALKSTAQSDAFLKAAAAPQNRNAFIIEGDSAKVGRFGYFPEWGELDGSVISPGLERIWAGEATPEQALPEICTQVDAFLKERGYPKASQ
jgi:multiple sugar transport system substrate-binding protein